MNAEQAPPADDGPPFEGVDRIEPILVDQKYVVIEGNHRVAGLRMIADQMRKAGRRQSRSTARSRGAPTGPAPPAAPGV